MSMRNPIYLDQGLLQNIADYLGVDYPVETKIRELGARERSGGVELGLPGVPIGAKGGGARSDEVERTYEAPVRPVRILNDVLDAAIEAGDVKRVVGDPNVVIARRDLIEIDGTGTLSAISEVGQLFDQFLPAMVSMPGIASPGGPPPDLLLKLFSNESGKRPLLFDFDSPGSPVSICIQLDTEWFHGNATSDDLVGDVTVFGTVDQLVAEGEKLNLERFLMPGANRAARRMTGPEVLTGLMEKMGAANTTLELEGPAWLVRPVAVF